MKEQEVKIEGVDKKIVVKEISWDDWLTLMEKGYSTRLFMKLSITEPKDTEFFKGLTKTQGFELLKVVNEINKENLGIKEQEKKEDVN